MAAGSCLPSVHGTLARIVAAADGCIQYIMDRNSKQRSPSAGECYNNYVWIKHANGEWTKYSLMKQGSTTVKAGLKVGDFVTEGTYLGDQGALGCAWPEHLHFEVVAPRADRPGIADTITCSATAACCGPASSCTRTCRPCCAAISPPSALGGVPRQILYDRMKTAVLGEDASGHIVYNRGLVDFARHRGFHPRACRPYRAKTEGMVERPYRYTREDFFLARSCQNLDDLNAQLRHWRDTVANPRVHATTLRGVAEAFAEEQPQLQPLPVAPFRSALRLERRVSHEGMVSLRGNYDSVPDTTCRRVLEVQSLADEIQIHEAGQLVARHPVLEGRNQRRVAPGHRKAPASAPREHAADEPIVIGRAGELVARRSLDFCEAVALRLASAERPS